MHTSYTHRNIWALNHNFRDFNNTRLLRNYLHSSTQYIFFSDKYTQSLAIIVFQETALQGMIVASYKNTRLFAIYHSTQRNAKDDWIIQL